MSLDNTYATFDHMYIRTPTIAKEKKKLYENIGLFHFFTNKIFYFSFAFTPSYAMMITVLNIYMCYLYEIKIILHGLDGCVRDGAMT